MKKTNYKCIVGAGEILLSQNGEGNNQLTTIEFQGDQFSMIELKKNGSIVQLSLRGEWEIKELGQALNEHGANWEGLETVFPEPNLLKKIKAYFLLKWSRIF